MVHLGGGLAGKFKKIRFNKFPPERTQLSRFFLRLSFKTDANFIVGFSFPLLFWSGEGRESQLWLSPRSSEGPVQIAVISMTPHLFVTCLLLCPLDRERRKETGREEKGRLGGERKANPNQRTGKPAAVLDSQTDHRDDNTKWLTEQQSSLHRLPLNRELAPLIK